MTTLTTKLSLAFCASALVACGGGGAGAIRGHAARGEIDALVALQAELDKERDQVALVQALSTHADDPRATRALMNYARSSDGARVRSAAFAALASAPGEDVDRLLITALGDFQPSVRAAAKSSVMARGVSMSGLLERAAISDANPLVRAASLEILTAESRTAPELGAVSSKVAVMAAEDPAPAVRAQALQSLGVLKLSTARPIIMERLRVDPSREVRMAAERALAKVGSGPAAAKATVAVLPLRVSGPDPQGRLARLAQRLTEVTRAKLSAAEVCEVVDREKMQEVLRELKKRGELVYDDDAVNVPAIGRFKIANQLVYGSVHAEGALYTVILQRLEVSTMELVPGAAVTLSGYQSELDRLIDESVDRFARGFR